LSFVVRSERRRDLRGGASFHGGATLSRILALIPDRVIA
jgi:hypothetical protein